LGTQLCRSSSFDSHVEPVFGHMKNLGFRGLCLWGLEKVNGDFALMCAAHYIDANPAFFSGQLNLLVTCQNHSSSLSAYLYARQQSA